MKLFTKLLSSSLLLSSALHAKTDFSTVPKTDTTSLTIYNTQPIAFVKDSRTLTMRKGENRLAFSWENSFIDPTSINMKSNAALSIRELTFPANTRQLGEWLIDSQQSGAAPVDISYFHSGFSWSTTWQATLNPAGTHINLKGLMSIGNFSGHDYQQAEIRTVAGKLNMKDQVSVLSRRQFPYATAVNLLGSNQIVKSERQFNDRYKELKKFKNVALPMARSTMALEMSAKVTNKKVSEYIMFSLPGKIDLPDRWNKSVSFVDAKSIPVKNLYRYGWNGEILRHQNRNLCYRFLQFKNNKANKLPGNSLPTGAFYLCRQKAQSNLLSFEGRSNMKYIPEGKNAEVFLGADPEIKLRENLKNFTYSDIRYNRHGNISGRLEHSTITYTVENLRTVPVQLEIYRNVNRHISIASSTGAKFKNESINEIKTSLELKPGEKRLITLKVTEKIGSLQ